MAVELVHINTDNGLIRIITSAGVKHEQQYSIDAALAKVAEYMEIGYEVVSAGSSVYVLKKPEGKQFIQKGTVDERPNF